MTDYTIIIPYGNTAPHAVDPSRETNLSVVVRHLRDHHPKWPILTGCDTFLDGWSKGAAVNRLVRRTSSQGLIVHDADVLVAPQALRSSALAVVAGAPWAMPHGTVYRLSRRGTMRFLQADLMDTAQAGAHVERAPHPAPPGGGITVLSRAAYDLTGGIDPRFVGWGGEDISWARALDTLVGPGVRGDAPLWHLWHQPDPTRLRGGRAQRGNEILASRYLDAVGDIDAMMDVISPATAGTPPPLTQESG